MSGDSFQLVIDAQVVAWYAAIVSSVLLAVRLADYIRDRARIKVTYQARMRMMGDPRFGPDALLTLVTVTNTGRRPVTIVQLNAQHLRESTGFIFSTSTPQVPYELTEGKYLTGIMKETEYIIDDVAYFSAVDASDKVYRVGVAPWYVRAIWNIRRRFI